MTSLEQAVAEAWAAVFKAERPGPEDDFFLAGGDSLAATRLASALQLSTGKEVLVEDIFIGQTVSGIAARVKMAVTDACLPTGSAAVLSSAQRRLWFVEQFVPGIPVHNIVMAERITGTLDIAALGRAFEQVSRHQAALRWRLATNDGLPAVTVADPEPVIIPFEDLSSLENAAADAALRALLDNEVRTAIDLTAGPLWRVKVVRCGEREHILVITVHHIIFDGWSQGILYREIGQAYRCERRGGTEQEPGPTGTTFADYTAWTRRRTQRDGRSDTEWWVEHLANAPTVLDIPCDRPRPAVLSFGGATRAIFIDSELAADVARLAMSEGATVGAVLLAAFSVLLRRLTGQHDQVVGIPVADRGHADFENLIGFLIRVLPLRLRVDDDAAFVEHVHRCSDELVAARSHADAPLEHIVEALGSQRDLTRNPLFQVMFNVYNFAEARLELDGADVRPWTADVPGSLVDLTLYVIFAGDGIRLEAAYNSDLFDGVRIEALLDSYAHLLRFLVRDRARPVQAACARPPGTGLPDWKSPLPSVIADSPGLLEQVRAAGRAAPESVAVEDPAQILSYRELLRIVDDTAGALRAAGAGPGDVVGVLAQRTANLPAVLLGILSTGARWAVVDCELPDAAVDRRLAAIKPRALIRCAGGAVGPALGHAAGVIDAADVVGTAMGGQKADVPAAERGVPAAEADVPAAERGYFSFTSGTTGEPKAIDAAEAPLVHFLNWYRTTFSLGGDSRFALLGGLAHDPLLRDMFTPLTCGGTLLVPAAELLRDPMRLLRWLADQRITVAHLTPQLVRMMAAAGNGAPTLESLRLVAVGGDQFTEGDAAALHVIAPHARQLNFYGTTETPQAQAYHEVRIAERALGRKAIAGLRLVPVPVGTGIDGAQLLVMSICGRPAAVGELGEVVIRSRYLSNGYVGQPANDGRFAPLAGAGEGRVYRTGDLGRYDPSGTVTLAGRSDDQVKIRGYRVELGAVESALCSHPDVATAAVRVFERAGASALHAYVVSAEGAVSESDLLQHARSRLPAYAVPSRVILLPALPMTSAGKVDRRALTAPDQASYANTASSDTPSSDLERQIISVWREVLGLPGIGSNDNFFEIGGNSMAIIEVQARLNQVLDRPVSVVDLFRFPTIRSLAGSLTGGQIDTGLLASELRGRTRQHRSGRRTRRPAQES